MKKLHKMSQIDERLFSFAVWLSQPGKTRIEEIKRKEESHLRRFVVADVDQWWCRDFDGEVKFNEAKAPGANEKSPPGTHPIEMHYDRISLHEYYGNLSSRFASTSSRKCHYHSTRRYSCCGPFMADTGPLPMA